jgi:hypothetical protein
MRYIIVTLVFAALVLVGGAIAGERIEIYKNDPENTPQKELITEVYVPLRP